MSKIRVDIDELCDKLDEIKRDNYTIVELDIEDDEDEFEKELLLSAVSFEEDEPISYGVVGEAMEELI